MHSDCNQHAYNNVKCISVGAGRQELSNFHSDPHQGHFHKTILSSWDHHSNQGPKADSHCHGNRPTLQRLRLRHEDSRRANWIPFSRECNNEWYLCSSTTPCHRRDKLLQDKIVSHYTRGLVKPLSSLTKTDIDAAENAVWAVSVHTSSQIHRGERSNCLGVHFQRPGSNTTINPSAKVQPISVLKKR